MKNKYYRQDTKSHICIWSDEWMDIYNKSQPERLNPVDHIEYVLDMICDSPNTENK